ncbi:MAG: FecR family protein [Rhodovibrionaceae bacterium]
MLISRTSVQPEFQAGKGNAMLLLRKFPIPLGASGLALILLLFAAPAQAEQAVIGEVVQRIGNATVVQEGKPRMLDPGVELRLADTVFTGAQAKVEIRLADGSLLSVGPGSELQLSTFHQRLGRGDAALFDGLIELVRGIIRATLAPAAEAREFDIRTRAAVAAARSTQFVVVDDREGSAVFVIEGRVEVRGRLTGEDVLLDPGFGTDVPLGGPPSPPSQWGAARVDRVLELTTLP